MFAVDTCPPSSSQNLEESFYCSSSDYSGDSSQIPKSIRKGKEFGMVFNLPELQICEENEVFKGLLLGGGGLDLIELNSGFLFEWTLFEKSDDSFSLLLFFEEFPDFKF